MPPSGLDPPAAAKTGLVAEYSCGSESLARFAGQAAAELPGLAGQLAGDDLMQERGLRGFIMARRHNARFKCAACRRWTIPRGTRNTRRIGWYPGLCKLCTDCFVAGMAAGDAKRKAKKQKP